MFGRSTILIATIITLFLIGDISGQDFGKVSDMEWQLIPPGDFPDIKALIIFDHGDIELTIQPIRLKLIRHVRMKVFSKDGADQALNIEIPYTEGDKIVGLKAHTINPGGEKIEVKDIHEKRVGAFRIITFTFPAVQDGAILEYKYKASHQRITFIDPWYFMNNLYTIESKFSFTPDPGFSYIPLLRRMPKYSHHPQQEVISTLKGEMIKYTWALYKQPPFRDEPLMMAKQDYRASILLQLKEYRDKYQRIPFVKDWGVIGGILKGRELQLASKGENDIREISDSLMETCTSPERYVAKSFSYVHEKIKTNEWANSDTFREILKKGEAGGADKNILLVRLLQLQGFTAYPMMIGTRDMHRFLIDEANELDVLSNVICVIAEGVNWYGLDTGPDVSVFPYLPPLSRVENGLLVWTDSCALHPLLHHERNSGCDILNTMRISNDGSAVCSASVYVKGYSMDGLMENLSQFTENDKWFRLIFRDIDIDYEVESADVRYEPENDRIVCDIVVSFPALCREIEGSYVFCPFVLHCFLNPFESIHRLTPIDFCYTFQDRSQLNIKLPENMRVFELPYDIQHRITGLSFMRHNQAVGNLIEISSTLKVTRPEFEIEQYPMLKNTFDAIESMHRDEILFTRDE
ncbi:MAG: DUF3857 domain-containing protein [Candidatus Zixiibacteriota bacterium]